jgi:hypothetical protein
MQITRTSKVTHAATSTLLTIATFSSAAHATCITKATACAMQKAKHSTLGLKLRPWVRLGRNVVMCVVPGLRQHATSTAQLGMSIFRGNTAGKVRRPGKFHYTRLEETEILVDYC